MSRSITLASFLLIAAMFATGQEPTTSPTTGNTPLQHEKNAAQANKDTSATTGDQITKPAEAKGATLIGCLTAPDKEGRFILRNMTYRMGVEVLGPDNLKDDAGSKVKLTGQWRPSKTQSQDKNATEMRRFQVTDVEVMAPTCKPPSETTPVSKVKKGKPTTYNAPSAESGK